MSALAERACTACGKGTPPLDRAGIEALMPQTPEWRLCDDATRIERRYRFADFKGAFAFVGQVARLAEAADHHPDIDFGWGYARLSLQTHAIGGLHDNDFILAARCDRAFSAAS